MNPTNCFEIQCTKLFSLHKRNYKMEMEKCLCVSRNGQLDEKEN